MIAIIDYGASNLRSVEKAFRYLGRDVCITSNEKDIVSASHLVLPGNGAFGDCMAAIEKLELMNGIKKFIDSGKPFLGICIGMQLLFEKSYEFGENAGLGLVKGSIEKFSPDIIKQGGKIPHVGWNAVNSVKKNKLFNGIDDGAYFYFVHSYFANPTEDEAITAVSDYYGEFTAAVEKDNVMGVQFHPEKSLKAGLKLLDNFCKI